jgi:hypothetical protein
MLDMYGRSYTPLIDRTTPNWKSIFQDQAVPGKPLIFTPEKIQAQLDRGQVLIIGVGIDGKGDIITTPYDPNAKVSSIVHWIVVEKVQPENATDGQVLIYNPYLNQEQVIPFRQLINGYKYFEGSDMPDGLFVSTSPSVSQNDNYPVFAKANYIIPNNLSPQNPQNPGTTIDPQKALNQVATTVQQKVVQPVQKALNQLATTVQQKVVQPVQKALNQLATTVQQKVVQPVQKALNQLATTVQQKVVQPAQKALKKVTTTIQQKVIQPAQKALNQVNTTVQQKVIQPAQKALNQVNTTVQQKVIQPAQKVMNQVNTTVQQKVIQPAQKVMNQVNTTVQQKVVQPAKNFLNSLVSTVKNIGKPASAPKSTPSTPVQKTTASVTKNQTSGRTNRRS